MSKTQKRNGGHNPSPYMRRFQLPALNFADPTDYDELLSPLESDAKKQLIEEKNKQLKNYFVPTTNKSKTKESASTSAVDVPTSTTTNCCASAAMTTTATPCDELEEQLQPPPVPPHRPHPRQRLIEIEKCRMCREILELERRSREMYDLLMSAGGNSK